MDSMSKQRNSAGFTVIEILVVALTFIIVGVLFFIQFNNLQMKNRDDRRKTAINSMYYTLEEVYFNDNGHYPSKITVENMPSVPESLLKDKDGVLVGEQKSEYRYEPTDCLDNECKAYTLRVDLEKEADFVKKSRNN